MMNCPNCQTLNPENARFCIHCGFAFAAAASCPNCGSAVLPGAKFCHNCGYALAAAGQPEIPGQLQKYIPKELLKKLQAARSDRSLEGERRVVTMLFCDVKGSTAMAELLDPEVWAEIMNGAFEYLVPPVYRYEGIIPRMMGDAILALFGAPITHEDDPQRAVRAGLEMVDGMREYRERLRRERQLDFNVRVGINTGLVVVGEVGTDLRLEYTAMGDAINLAARMEQTAEPGSVQISEHTYRLVAPLFEVEPLGGIAVKGKSEPVAAYRVTGLKSIPRRSFGIAGIDIPLVGRVEEMRQMRGRIASLHQGQGGIICLIGESGLGKTRLIEELRDEWDQKAGGRGGGWDMVSGASFVSGRPYGQFRQHMTEHNGILETDPPEVVREKISQMYSGSLAVLREQAILVYSHLLGLSGADGETHPLAAQGEAFKRQLFDLVFSFERLWLGGQPGVQVFDDLHWTDPASAELLVHLLQLAEEAPILFICAFRPEPDAAVWKVREAAQTRYSDRYTEIVLKPLTRKDSQTMVSHLFSGNSRGQGLVEQILEKTEGNPLFIEETIRELLERGIVARGPGGLERKGDSQPAAIEIPDSLHALVMARLDRLAEDTRQTLQMASIIGRSFDYRVLRAIVDDPTELERELQTLQQGELIRETARQPEREFQFRQALTQEAAYSSILIKHRREHHRRVAEAMETLFADRLEDQAESLAYHYDAAGDSRARRYYLLAGKKAVRVYARSAAIDAFSRALAIAGSLSTDETITIHELRGQTRFLLGQFEAARADFEAARQAARDAGLTGDEVRIMSRLAWLGWSSGRGAEALALAQEAEARSLASGDQDQALYASIIVGSAQQNLGDIAGAREHVRRALSASIRQGNDAMAALSLYYLAMQENFSGQFGRAAVYAHKAYELHMRLGDRTMACGGLFTQSLAEGGRGRYDSALAILERGRQLGEETQTLWLLRYPNQRAWLSAELGDWESAYAFDLAGLHPAQALPGFREIEISTQINLVIDCIALNRLAEAQDLLAEAEKDLDRPEFQSHHWRWKIRVADARARLELAQGNLAGAAKSAAGLLDQAEQTEARKYTALGLALRGQIQLAEGAHRAAEADLRAALEAADRLCYIPVRVRARLLLARLSRQNGKNEQARQYFAEAAEIIDGLDATIRHPELRHSFEQGLRKEIADFDL